MLNDLQRKWLSDPSKYKSWLDDREENRRTGRTYAIVVKAIEKALYLEPGGKVEVYDHGRFFYTYDAKTALKSTLDHLLIHHGLDRWLKTGWVKGRQGRRDVVLIRI